MIHELFYFIGGTGGWLHNLPSAAAGAVPVRPGTSPTSWYTTPENVQHIAYVGTDGMIHECFYFIGERTGGGAPGRPLRIPPPPYLPGGAPLLRRAQREPLRPEQTRTCLRGSRRRHHKTRRALA